jgi:hypothetical protein
MKKEELNAKLKQLDLSVSQFADMIGFNPATIRSFNDEKRPVPFWIEGYLSLYEKSKSYEEIKKKVFSIEKIAKN